MLLISDMLNKVYKENKCTKEMLSIAWKNIAPLILPFRNHKQSQSAWEIIIRVNNNIDEMDREIFRQVYRFSLLPFYSNKLKPIIS